MDVKKHNELMNDLIPGGIKNRMFRLLESSEIECRVSTVKQNGFSVLLYKDARCDMNILDETVGAMNWRREHSRDNANCTVSIYDSGRGQWVGKEDTGAESYTEKEKGLASDSFKRACFNWGIGRELYTSPFIWIYAIGGEIISKNNKFTTYAKMYVKSISYDANGVINDLTLTDKEGNVRYSMNKLENKPEPQKKNYEDMFNNASNLEELKLLWDGLTKQEKTDNRILKETRKKEILNFKS